jgi:hypothetical protein
MVQDKEIENDLRKIPNDTISEKLRVSLDEMMRIYKEELEEELKTENIK